MTKDYTSHHANGHKLNSRQLVNVVSQPLKTTLLTFFLTSLITSFLSINCHPHSKCCISFLLLLHWNHLFLHLSFPLSHFSLLNAFLHFSCLWRTQRQSSLGWRSGTPASMESALWLSPLWQVCQVCVCPVAGNRHHVGSKGGDGDWSQHGYPCGSPSLSSFTTCLLH